MKCAYAPVPPAADGGCRPAGAAGYIVSDLSGAVRLKRRFDRERESFGLLQNVLYKGNEHGCDTIPPSLQLSKLLLTCTTIRLAS